MQVKSKEKSFRRGKCAKNGTTTYFMLELNNILYAVYLYLVLVGGVAHLQLMLIIL